MKKIVTFISPIATYFILFSTSFAASGSCNFGNIQNFKDFVSKIISCFLNPIVSLVVSFSVVIFLFGVFKFISSESGGEGKNDGKSFMFWGIIGIFVMVSLWGLVNIFKSTFSLNNDTLNTPPIVVPK